MRFLDTIFAARKVDKISISTVMTHNNMISSAFFEKLMEQHRLAYAHLLKIHIQYCIKYKYFKNRVKDEKLQKDLNLIDRFFFDDSGKIKWDTVRLLMPPKIEEKIKKEFKTLNGNEIKLCCLILFNVPNKYITDLLPYTQTSVHSISYRIRQKIGKKNIKESLKMMFLRIPTMETE